MASMDDDALKSSFTSPSRGKSEFNNFADEHSHASVNLNPSIQGQTAHFLEKDFSFKDGQLHAKIDTVFYLADHG